MFLSIIIPIYNDEKFLAECLDSCLVQDIPSDDYELICVDDGSIDRTPEILADYAGRYPNIVAISKNNGGVSSARNVGLDAARGNYLWFVDSDDLLVPNVLQELKRIITEHRAERLIVSYWGFHNILSAEERESIVRGEKHGTAGGDNYVTQSIYLRRIIEENGLRFSNTDIVYGEDTLFVYEAKKYVLKEFNADTIAYLIRFHDASAVKNVSLDKQKNKIHSYFKCASIMRNDYDSELFQFPMPKSFVADQIMMLSRKALEVLAELPIAEFRVVLRELKNAGMYPVKQLPEATYTVRECANEPSGTSKIRNIFRFYSINYFGLYLSAMPYRVKRIKVSASHYLRKKSVFRWLLDIKNKVRVSLKRR